MILKALKIGHAQSLGLKIMTIPLVMLVIAGKNINRVASKYIMTAVFLGSYDAFGGLQYEINK